MMNALINKLFKEGYPIAYVRGSQVKYLLLREVFSYPI